MWLRQVNSLVTVDIYMGISSNSSSDIPGESLASYLAKGMNAKSVTQIELSKRTGLSQGYVSSLLKGKKEKPSEKVLRFLAGALELDIEKLFELVGITYNSTPVRPVLVGVAGASASGKSWFANKVRAKYGTLVSVVSIDGYYKSRNDVLPLKYQYDNPEALKLDDALADLMKLKAGIVAHIPNYDYAVHEATSWTATSPTPIIIFEGHLLFHGVRLRREFDLRIWMEASSETRLKRRVLRDIKDRDRQLDSVMTQYFDEVLPAYREFIAPNRGFADIAVVNDIECEDETIPLAVDMVVRYVQSLPCYGTLPAAILSNRKSESP